MTFMGLVLPGGNFDAVDCLEKAFRDLARQSHSSDAPGAARGEEVPLDSFTPLSAQMPLLGSRDGTFESGLFVMAHIFRRWTRRGYMNEGDNFRKGLAHLLLLSCSGSGMSL